jgi:hypothetical protein
MSKDIQSRTSALLRSLGSLWLGTVLLVVILVAMACATVFESLHGTEQALATFYKSWWFMLLLGLLAINAGIAIALRWPFSRKQIGFVVTHGCALVILAGSLVTEYFGVDGQVGILEGDTVEHVTVARDTVTLIRQDDEAETKADLGRLPGGGLHVAEPAVPPLSLGDVQIKVSRYVPDSEESREVVNDNPSARLALELSMSDPHGRTERAEWVFADRTTPVGSLSVLLREVDEDELERLSGEPEEESGEGSESVGLVRVDYQGTTFEFPVEDCQQEAVAVGESGFTLRVLRYMPHAVVGRDNQLENASDQPVNPAIEVELTGPDGSLRRPAFASFPDFWSTHGAKNAPGIKVVFAASSTIAPPPPVSVLSGPDDELYARFASQGRPVVMKQLTIGEPCDSPWAGLTLTVLRRFDHARVERIVDPVEPVRQKRTPALLLEVTDPSGTEEVWLQKYRSHAVRAEGSTYAVLYGNQRVPLGFSVTLKDFQIGFYPGTRRPRSFESQISILDPASGRESNHVVSMNHPASHGGYTFYQSSYREQGQKMVSMLSVSRDPVGQLMVFAGYIGLLVGMSLVLTRRILDRRAAAGRHHEAGSADARSI